MDDTVFEHSHAVQAVTEFFGTDKDSSHDGEHLTHILALPLPVVACFAALLRYLREFGLENTLRAQTSFQKISMAGEHLLLSGTTLRNLEIFQNQTDRKLKGSLLWAMDHTRTPFGRRLLRHWLAQPLTSISAIEERLDTIKELLSSHGTPLSQLHDLLNHFPDLERGLASIYHKKCSTQEFYLVTSTLGRLANEVDKLSGTVEVRSRSVLLKKLLLELPQRLDPVRHFVSLVNEKAAREGDKTQLFVNLDEFPQIRKRKQEIEEVFMGLRDHRKELRVVLRSPSADYVTVSGQEFLIEVKNSLLHNVPSDWLKIGSTKAVSRFHTPYVVREYQKLCRLREQLKADANTEWLLFLGRFGQHYIDFRVAVTYLATFDCLFSLATVASRQGYCRPSFVERSQLEIENGRHPVVELLMQEHSQFVPNDTKLCANGRRVMIVTGPNMGGKSSYIRQVALIAIMAQMGSFVPAESAHLGILRAIHTRMGASDDIYHGRSTFMEELTEASAILRTASHDSLVILDELGRGTSTHDGVAIAYATLEYFICEVSIDHPVLLAIAFMLVSITFTPSLPRKVLAPWCSSWVRLFFCVQVKCLTLFVTHYPLACDLETQYPGIVSNYHMSFFMHDSTEGEESFQSVTFLYQLTAGPAGCSYGLNVARLAEVPTPVLVKAAREARMLEELVRATRERMKLFTDIWTLSGEGTTDKLRHLLREALVENELKG
uniref:MutS homolog 3 (E. coli) n=1 Tax=Eptatretus burgeri TaxID=7764 RepID=A0A8C4NFC8_EPTBU